MSVWVPAGAPATFERVDQGVDFRTTPGGPIVAPYAGTVTLAQPNPGGFGTRYPLITFTEGPWKGQQWYVGHVLAQKTGQVRAGDVIGITGKGTESWQGNAKGIPGHAEVGKWPPGPMSAGAAIKSAVLGGAGPTATSSSTSPSTPGSSGPSAIDLAGDITNPPKFLADLANVALQPIADAGIRMLLYAVFVFGGIALLVLGVTRAAGLKHPTGGLDLATA